MSKTILLFLLANIYLPTRIYCQSIFPINAAGEVEYTEVITTDSASSTQLYGRAKMAIAKSFNSSKAVIENDNPESKQILLKGNIRADYSWNPLALCPARVDFIMTISCKDNKYKYSIKPIGHKFDVGCRVSGGGGGNLTNDKPDCGTFNMPKSYWVDIKNKANQDFLSFISDFKKQMLVSESEDW